MIKFFRHIRQSLLNHDKTSKPAFAAGRYFKYAIGEIVLVVIGILIAVQINNWNEKRINKIAENNLLKNLLEDVKSDSTFFSSRNIHLTNYLNNIQNLNAISNNNATDSILNNPFYSYPIFEISMAFQSTVINNNTENTENFSTKSIKSLLREYSLQHHYLTLAYNQKDEMYERHLENAFKEYHEKTFNLDPLTTIKTYYDLVEYPKHKKTVNFLLGVVYNSLNQTTKLMQINNALKNAIIADLNNE